ncbi:hypothetical protein B7495_04760 [Cryobacterium sp. LW097]|uniref:hypothetical protein n=1 Tax=Cryobacterium sp. LW097 TaxID=1978566 RepID=UPI000B4CF122|nr:hypothetical protein [Cryobacterium sp. LW097]ASD21485.1 hypothetical protein B7495_04760 [Cryobacterium sp. LW097]
MDASSPTGTTSPVEGSTTAEERLRAFQMDMLQVDVDYAVEWIDTMAALVGQHLDHEPFTEKRIAALHKWEADRKNAQVRLRYRYDVSRRPARLIDESTRKVSHTAHEDLRVRLQELADRGVTKTPWKKSPIRKLADQMERDAKAAIAAEDARPPAQAKPETPADFAAQFIAEISKASGVPDVLTTSDTAIRTGLRRNGMDTATANRMIGKLRKAVYAHTGQRRPLIDDGE